MVVDWLACPRHNTKVMGLIPSPGFPVWRLHVLPVPAWFFFGYAGFLPNSKNMNDKLIDRSKLSLSVIVSVCCSDNGWMDTKQ